MLRKRLAKGLLTRIQYEEEAKRRKQKQVEVGKKVGTRSRVPIDNIAWDRAVASAKVARYVLKHNIKPTEQHAHWRYQVRALIRLTLAEIATQRHVHTLVLQNPLWYDAVSGTRKKLQALIDTYPDGANAAPLQIL